MLLDINELESGGNLHHEICIVGSGPAGLTIARKLGSQGHDVAVLESGGLNFDEATQGLYAGESTRYESIEGNRLRYFGGSSNHWAGVCRPFSPDDFVDRPWIRGSQWPLSYAEIEPYFEPAMQTCQGGAVTYNWSEEYWRAAGGHPKLANNDPPFEFSFSQQIVAQQHRRNKRNKGISFSTLYQNEVRQSDSIKVYLNANVTQLVVNEAGDQITQLELKTLGGKSFEISAQVYVLACGGIENARLLLASNQQLGSGIANSSDSVGRYFCDHSNVDAAELITVNTKHARGGIPQLWGATRVLGEVKRKHEILNGVINIKPEYDSNFELAKLSNGVRSLRRLSSGDIRADTLLTDIGYMIADFDDIAARAYAKALPNRIPVQRYRIRTKIEMHPKASNRVSLGSEKDALGIPKTHLNFRFSEDDARTISTTARLVAEKLSELNLGRARLLVSDRDTLESSIYRYEHHHMGTTRMSSDPKLGVTDGNCRSHDVRNLYLAGSSVFPTGGSGTPTLMIVALALRLAEHLGKRHLANN